MGFGGCSGGRGVVGGRGFTLVEVLAGLVLVAIVLPVAVRALQVGMGAGDMARQRLEAVSLAQSKVDEIVALRDWDRGEVSGAFDEPFERYAYAVELADFDDEVRTLTVVVTWERRGQAQALRLATLVDTSIEE
ncbi:prepilin-type N-terminal cleavage/methylation domain-containing protein [Phycisphaerales bacterium AB-hyl4]|uniref:Prepilin-type N-terminal cleavage/methylation domain-containing protein n=1 Tax=Natronomicrosphaera hydrolytica TaxID=3242702 RepID=A0ABV4TZG1_9BACT